MKASVIIPVYNEEETVGNVIETVLKSEFVCQVICVNDGSTDKSLDILKSFGHKIDLINFKKNKGKGAALASGIEKTREKIIVFIDSDLIGLKAFHVEKLIKTLVSKKVDGVLGDLDISEIYYKMISYSILSFYGKGHDPLTGERAYFRKDLLPYVSKMRKLGYGIELYLNHIFKNKKIKFVKLSKLTQPSTYQKNDIRIFRRIFKRLLEPSKELIKQITTTDMIRLQKEIMKKNIKRKLKSYNIIK